MRKILTLLLLVAGFTAFSQKYNHEWIHYSQTYYKIRIANDGLYRIPKTLLDAYGLGGAQVQFLELWRNGERVPFYPSVSSGVLPSNGYIEFWGEKNDGKPDNALYRDPSYQHTKVYSLQSDTATYFLSVSNNTAAGIRYIDVNNDVAGNSLPVEPYFMYTSGYYYGTTPGNKPNLGVAWNVGSDVYSSSYDEGEFFASPNIDPASTLSTPLVNLNVYPAGQPSILKFGAAGNASNTRNIVVRANGVTVKDTVMSYYDDLVTTAPIDNNSISSGSLTVSFNNSCISGTDRMVVSFLELTYPRTFNFNGASNFKFELPAKSGGYFLRISNFAFGGALPVLYDRKNGERYTANLNGGVVEFALPGSAVSRHLVLVSEDGSNISTVTTMSSRNFVNYKALAATGQAMYIIVSNPILYVGSNGNNPVQDYKSYRESAAGGNKKVMIAEIGDLVDQFAFGINKHPLSVRNFIRYARDSFPKPPENVFLIGKGVTYYEYQVGDRAPGGYPLNNQLNLVPTFGYPGSDNLLSAEDLTVPVATTPIGRLSVVAGKEIEDYLEKVKEYELVQKNAGNTIADRAWMKNVVHVTGSTDSYLGTVLCNYMDIYRRIIEDTLYGGHVYTFCKASTSDIDQFSPDRLSKLFTEGISFLTYFGHSSATTLEFNIEDPYHYNNQGKYPVFFVNGCKAGDFFTYYAPRLQVNETLSEKFTLAKQRGAIAFIASTHFGVVNYLNMYLSSLYQILSSGDFDKPLGVTMRDAFQNMINGVGSYDFYARMHAEQMTLNGDPAIVINAQPKPDYVIEQSLIKVTPVFISLAEKEFDVKVIVKNLGKAVSDSVLFEIKQQYPNGTTGVLFSQKIRGVRESDSVVLTVPLLATRDKGLNKIIATIDGNGAITEISESNNTASQDFYIYEDEARPVFPYAYAITNDATEKLIASTANPESVSKNWVMEIDTAGAFNSNLLIRKTITTGGGIIEFDPGLHYLDSTVYYWRIAPDMPNPNDIRWNTVSFTYINGHVDGFSQSQYHQFKDDETVRVFLDSVDHTWKYGTRENSILINNGVFPAAATQAKDIGVTINYDDKIQSVCSVSGLVFYVFDSVSLAAWYNNDALLPGRFGSDPVCGVNRRWQFQFNFSQADTAKRRAILNFLDMIPSGSYVAVNNIFTSDYPWMNMFASEWQNDTAYFGHNNSIYHRLLEQGFVGVDSVNTTRAFIFLYRKDRRSLFPPQYVIGPGGLDIAKRISLLTKIITPDTLGYINSPKFGPAAKWRRVVWDGKSIENPSNDNPTVDVVGSDYTGKETVLFTLDKNTRDFDISNIDIRFYPFVQLKMRNIDSITVSPFQLKYWRVLYDPVPEGALAANIAFSARDTAFLSEKVPFSIAYKNISKLNFDSMLVRVSIIDRNNNTHVLSYSKYKPIVAGDTILVQAMVDTKDYAGNNVVQIEVNPDNDKPEYYHFNNVLYHNLYVIADQTSPLMDVTFDGVHILNKDIVSAKPHIQIKIKDESMYRLLSDTSISTVQVKYPDGNLRTYHFNDGDTLRFIPATSTSDNTATIEFTPQFTSQINPEGDDYELVVTGKDASGNKTGNMAYRIGFRVIAKPMISNLLNYPNPFSTSTAFVFTLTGSEIPQNLRIQILTVTGKIVREITTNELGPLHIGRNITDYKWDGRDQYGDKLANGVYLYRVITSLNGKTLDKYKASGDNTDKYFNNGYGKMYLMH
ncbi:hypothetical protein A4H97_22320 [Niastella yeongjuensis]|uniref:Gingipain domain-containing protein n=1 Tax=Niastella yeongjuensis TaxID=354355 RepID=A0A1V9F7D0_9BACT|nr:C25 family cysteine peptidase [Niastella yeongjuensis]OQP54235.1 hypothetical protein A4H97_22320 [Niastella yeongjuensis]SEP31526.1 Peptidase family C25 [Niastella yeongjuensis]